MRTIRLPCALVLVISACSAPAGEADCPSGFTCTTLHVPVDRRRPDSPSLDPAVIAADTAQVRMASIAFITRDCGRLGLPDTTAGRRRRVRSGSARPSDLKRLVREFLLE
jgi:hypothetical protein